MNYEEYLIKLCTLPCELVQQLTHYVEHEVDYSVDSTFWNQRRHVGISGVRFPNGVAGPLQPAIDLIQSTGLVGKFLNYEIDVLGPNGHIKWHTDVTTIGNRCEQTHRAHIPLTGDGEYGFSSTRGQSYLKMEHGNVYLFNNFVQHQVRNHGSVPRINIMLNFDSVMNPTAKWLLS